MNWLFFPRSGHHIWTFFSIILPLFHLLLARWPTMFEGGRGGENSLQRQRCWRVGFWMFGRSLGLLELRLAPLKKRIFLFHCCHFYRESWFFGLALFYKCLLWIRAKNTVFHIHSFVDLNRLQFILMNINGLLCALISLKNMLFLWCLRFICFLRFLGLLHIRCGFIIGVIANIITPLIHSFALFFARANQMNELFKSGHVSTDGTLFMNRSSSPETRQ